MPNNKPPQSKLLKLKQWVTVPEAAKHLSIVFNEEVTEADILRLALDGHLKLSVYFVNKAYAHYGKVVSYEGVIWKKAGPLLKEDMLSTLTETFKEKLEDLEAKDFMYMKSLNLDDERYLNLEKEVKNIDGVWDLPMIGNERNDVEHEYQGLTGGPEVTLINLDGTFVERENGVMCQIQERFDNVEGKSLWVDKIKDIANSLCAPNITDSEKAKLLKESEYYEEKHKYYLYRVKEKKDNFYHEGNFYPAGKLPDDSVLVVRTQALMNLVNSFSSDLEVDAGPFQFEVPEGTTWRDIRLVIRNNDLTEWLEVNGPEGPLGNYKPEEIGFRGHSGPGQAWTLLTKLAETNGILSPRGRDLVKPTVSRLRKSLRELFPGIEGDPIPWRKTEKSWRTAFPIELIRYEEE